MLAAAFMLLIVVRVPMLLGMVFPTLLLGWLLVTFIAPAHYALELARTHALRRAQATIAVSLTLAAWATNMMVVGVLVLAATAVTSR